MWPDRRWAGRAEEAYPPPPRAGLSFPAFPHKPYQIQTDFMVALYRSLEAGGVCLLESPTGAPWTGAVVNQRGVGSFAEMSLEHDWRSASLD